MKVQSLYGAEHFLLGDLIELGRRLTDYELEKMHLLDSVVKAEKEYYWRIKSISDLMRDFTNKLKEDVDSEVEIAKQYAFDPKRKGSRLIGRRSRSYKRSLPKPGTLIIRKFGQKYFRFVVVDTPSRILRLGETNGGIYLSVSRAASDATGSSQDGWRFFECNLPIR